MSLKLNIIGAGGHARSLINIAKDSNYDINGIYDDSFELNHNEVINGIKLLGTLDEISKKYPCILAIGNNKKRKIYFKKNKKEILIENLKHKISHIEDNVILGKANQFFYNSYVNSETRIGNNNILNTGCIIEHEVIIGNHNHISIGAILCGRVRIGDNCFIGSNVTVIDGIKICDNVIIGAGSVVVKDITSPGTYIGSPIRKIK
tara:strand:- start:84 stop:698 length:615 start_codon:yes stop_codon:yes gene_type:complete